jgi:hypothetical protein
MQIFFLLDKQIFQRASRLVSAGEGVHREGRFTRSPEREELSLVAQKISRAEEATAPRGCPIYKG